MQGIAGGAFGPASVHAVMIRGLADYRFDGLTPLEGLAQIPVGNAEGNFSILRWIALT